MCVSARTGEKNQSTSKAGGQWFLDFFFLCINIRINIRTADRPFVLSPAKAVHHEALEQIDFKLFYRIIFLEDTDYRIRSYFIVAGNRRRYTSGYESHTVFTIKFRARVLLQKYE